MLGERTVLKVILALFLACLLMSTSACSGSGGGGDGGGGGGGLAEPTDGDSITIAPDPEAAVFVGTNLIALHDSSSPQYSNRCVDSPCHGSMKYETSLNPAIQGAHVAMLPETPGDTNNERCLHCHRDVDYVEHSAEALRRQVDPSYCAVCHGSQGPGTQFYAN